LSNQILARNQLIISGTNIYREIAGMEPIIELNPRLFQLADKEAERMLETRISQPDLSLLKDKKALFFVTKFSGSSTITDMLYGLDNGKK
jgi:hypothetical protein